MSYITVPHVCLKVPMAGRALRGHCFKNCSKKTVLGPILDDTAPVCHFLRFHEPHGGQIRPFG